MAVGRVAMARRTIDVQMPHETAKGQDLGEDKSDTESHRDHTEQDCLQAGNTENHALIIAAVGTEIHRRYAMRVETGPDSHYLQRRLALFRTDLCMVLCLLVLVVSVPRGYLHIHCSAAGKGWG